MSFSSDVGDSMVVQRDEPIAIRGTAAPRTRVTVRLGDATQRTRADRNGRFEVTLPAMSAGGPYTLSADAGDGYAEVSDVLVGDVWLCSGQSNMEFPVRKALNADDELAKPTSETIRVMKVPLEATPAPADALPDGAAWKVASAESLRDFSAVCYFAAREVQENEDVPLGLIDNSWGGAQIEAYVSAETLKETTDEFGDELALLADYAKDEADGLATFGEQWEAWWHDAAGDTSPWAEDHDASAWKAVPAMSDWREWGDPRLSGSDGVVWLRNTADLTAEQAAAEAPVLSLGSLSEVDSVWINGEYVANEFGWSTPRDHALPQGVLREGENTIVVNVNNRWGPGGLHGPAEAMQLRANGTVPLAEGWTYDVAPKEVGQPPRAPWESVHGLTTIANGMMAPLDGRRFKAGVWYQGESNTGKPDTYEALLNAMIAEWRGMFGEDLPVVLVQLPGFGALPAGPADSGWAGVREAERQVALDDENVGLAVIIDAGDRFDIHPANKQIVGHRVATMLERLAYGEEGATDGRSPAAARMDGGDVVVTFPDGPEIRAVGYGAPVGFELCEEDGACRYAAAVLDGDEVRLDAEGTSPTEVRYGWADVPLVNLYEEDDRPVTPFRLPIEAAD
ncbi:sialate O-acetylesterase [Parvularcula dongshanensis]|uniref:sialate O-acetylesterase n=1 Tax=Parvularcula dongshanensis TaxID=1173995 RepID=UPI00161E9ADB